MAGSGEEPATPNVLLIVTDDQRVEDTLEVMDFTTKWFGNGGTRYPNTFATTPLCCPSRASIFTGRYAHNHDVLVNHRTPQLDFDTTIQRHLKDAGYATGFVGKYLNNWPVENPPPYFDRFAFFTPSTEERFAGNLYLDIPLNIDGMLARIPQYSTHFMTNQSLSYMMGFEEEDDRPWFMMVAPYAPHLPAIAESKYEKAAIPPFVRNPAQNEKDTTDKPDLFAATQHEEHNSSGTRTKQLRSLLSVDDMVSRLASGLDCLGETDETVAIFMSDNGYLWGEHGLRRKGTPYTEAVAVPLLARFPKGKHPRVDDRIAANIDIAPTIADIADLPADVAKEMDGKSLLAPSERESLLLEFWPNRREDIPRWNTLRTDQYHYVEYETEDGKLLARELFDLERDPWLLRNLLGDENRKNDPSKSTLRELSEELQELQTCRSTECR